MYWNIPALPLLKVFLSPWKSFARPQEKFPKAVENYTFNLKV